MNTIQNRKNQKGQAAILVLLGVIVIVAILVFAFLTETIRTGQVGVITEFGKVTGETLEEGFHFVGPTQAVNEMTVQKWTQKLDAPCFSSDLQQVDVVFAVQLHITKSNASNIFQQYGLNYPDQVWPKIFQVLKDETAKYPAAELVSKREDIRRKVIELAVEKLKGFVEIDDISIVDISFGKEYKDAIEAKQVAQQKAEQAVYELQRAKVESDQKVAAARGEAESIQIVGEALAKNPALVQLELVKKWDGKAPQTVVSGSGGANIILPIGK